MCREIKWEEYNKSVETKKLLPRQMKHEEGINSITTRYLLSQQEIKEQCRKNTEKDKFMLRHNEKQKTESMSQQNHLLLRN